MDGFSLLQARGEREEKFCTIRSALGESHPASKGEMKPRPCCVCRNNGPKKNKKQDPHEFFASKGGGGGGVRKERKRSITKSGREGIQVMAARSGQENEWMDHGMGEVPLLLSTGQTASPMPSLSLPLPLFFFGLCPQGSRPCFLVMGVSGRLQSPTSI